MTVEELKEILNQYPNDAKIAIGWISHTDDYARITHVESGNAHFDNNDNTLCIDIVIE